ncbi:MAG: hypothetical protein FJ405_14555 [Verrucomicrobia bacterium]|nr:hypothetical protein [Verrucomicrobiota bacterium]
MSLSPKGWIRRLVRGRIAASAIAAAGTLHLQGAKITPLQPATGTAKAGFGLLSPADTALTFTNQLSDREAAINQIRLNGSGVALGDVNADGLTDIYLCGLENSNALYLNQGS